jgi:hypothetical protein
MQVAARPYVTAGAVLAAASLVAVTPIAQRAIHLPTLSIETQLVDSSIVNIPFNLFQEIVNIPNSEINAVTYAAESLFNTGPWFVVSNTNLWGVDPGDPSHFMSVTNFLVPFGGLSGIDAPETDFDAGLGQQLWGLAAAALPTSSGCDAVDCLPVSPTSPITGISGVDWFIWLSQILNGQQEFPLFDNWFKVSFDQVLAGYYFDPAADGSTDPSGPAYTIFDNMPGTGLGDAMPWSGMTYTLQPWVPIENWINGLMADPNYSNFEIPEIEEIGRALQALTAASVVAFDPFTAGSPFCPGQCADITNANADYINLVQAINNAWPGNETIETWLNAYDNGVANVPTEDQIQRAIEVLQQGFWDFDNPSAPAGSGPDYTETAQWFYNFWTSLGFDPSNNPATSDFSGDLASLANAFSPEQLAESWAALGTAFGPEQLTESWSALSSAFDPGSFDLSALFGDFDPAAMSLDLGDLFSGFDPTAMSADFATLIEDLTSAWVPDLATSALSAL